ncbi:hypothetical protein [Metabacillus sp. RGM 3146]
MRISLFGSTGRAGMEFLKRSLADGHMVKACLMAILPGTTAMKRTCSLN